MDPTWPAFPIFAFTGFLMTLIPMYWHIRAWNSGTVLYMFWTSIGCLLQFTNAIVWHNNALNSAPVYCDIASKFFIGASVGIPASSLCIMRRLYKISAVRVVSVSRQDRIRDVYVDLGIALGLPALVMCLHVVVQGHRGNLVEDVGCMPVVVNTPAAYPLVYMWPVLIGVISFFFAASTFRSFIRLRANFTEVLSASAASLSLNQYLRLMTLALTEMALTLPLALWTIINNLTRTPVEPYGSWADMHFDFNRFDPVPAVYWHADTQTYASIEITRWTYPFCAFVFFCLFGFAAEARKHYAQVATPLMNAAGRMPGIKLIVNRHGPANASRLASSARLPVYIAPPKYGGGSKASIASTVAIPLEKWTATDDDTISLAPSSPGLHSPQSLVMSGETLYARSDTASTRSAILPSLPYHTPAALPRPTSYPSSPTYPVPSHMA